MKPRRTVPNNKTNRRQAQAQLASVQTATQAPAPPAPALPNPPSQITTFAILRANGDEVCRVPIGDRHRCLFNRPGGEGSLTPEHYRIYVEHILTLANHRNNASLDIIDAANALERFRLQSLALSAAHIAILHSVNQGHGFAEILPPATSTDDLIGGLVYLAGSADTEFQSAMGTLETVRSELAAAVRPPAQ